MNAGLELTRRQALAGAGALAGTAAMPLMAQGQGATRWPEVLKLLQGYVQGRRVSGMVAALGWGQQAPDVLAAGRDSFSSPRASTADSLYRIYSMTKPVTGMAAMMLVDEGKLGLDQPVAEILPKFTSLKVQKVADGPITATNLEPAARPITVRMLLTHTAGLGYGSLMQQGPIAQAYMDRGIVPGAVSRLEQVGLFRGTPAPSLAAFADRLAELPLVYQPGTRWSYSVGLDLMGRVIEVVARQPFDAFLKQRLFDPLGMTSTFFRVPASERGRLTANYYKFGAVMLPIDIPENSVFLDNPPFPFGGAGLVSSPRDYDRFLKMIANLGVIDGKRVMSEAAVRLGTSDLLPPTVKQALGGGLGLDLSRYGFGAGGRVGKGAQEGVYGWAGAAGTIGFADVRRGLRAGLYTQYMPSGLYPLETEFPAAVIKDVAAQALRRL